MPRPNSDQRSGDAAPCHGRPVPRPFRVAAPRKMRPKSSSDLVEDMVADLQKFPFAFRISLMVGGAGALWLGIFHVTQILLK